MWFLVGAPDLVRTSGGTELSTVSILQPGSKPGSDVSPVSPGTSQVISPSLSPQLASGDHPVRGQERRPERTASRLPAGGALACDHAEYTVAAQSARRAWTLPLRRGQRASSEALDAAGLTVYLGQVPAANRSWS